MWRTWCELWIFLSVTEDGFTLFLWTRRIYFLQVSFPVYEPCIYLYSFAKKNTQQTSLKLEQNKQLKQFPSWIYFQHFVHRFLSCLALLLAGANHHETAPLCPCSLASCVWAPLTLDREPDAAQAGLIWSAGADIPLNEPSQAVTAPSQPSRALSCPSCRRTPRRREPY